MDFLTSMFSIQEMSPSDHEQLAADTTTTEKCDIPLSIFAKAYAVNQLRRNGYTTLAESVIDFKLEGKTLSHIINKITSQFANERQEQLEDICFELQITEAKLKDTFQTISDELFRDEIKWGRIVSFVAFSGALVLYCAEHGMQSKVQNLLEWIDQYVTDNLSPWISLNGGCQGLVDHFISQEASLPYSLIPNIFMGFGVASLAVAAGGLLAYKKKLLL